MDGADAGAVAGAAMPSRPTAAVFPGSGASGNSTEPRDTLSGGTIPETTTPPVDEAGAAQADAVVDAGPSAASRKFCAWVGCGRQLPPDPAVYSKCGRCQQAFCCDRTCQKRHWGRGGHKEACAEPPCCTICLDGGDDPVPIQCGCACRGDGGLAHIACRAEVAARKQAGWHEGWNTCPTCGQRYTGAMRLGLARELADRMGTRRRDDYGRLAAAHNLGDALNHVGEFAEAADVMAGVLAARKRVYGKEHPISLQTATSLADTYSVQGKIAEAEELQDWVVEASRRVNGKEHPDTLLATACVASTYFRQGRFAEAEALQAEVLEASRRVLGAAHRDTLAAAINLAGMYNKQGKLAEAVVMSNDVLATSRRVLGAGHPDTCLAARNLAISYTEIGKGDEAAVLRALCNIE